MWSRRRFLEAVSTVPVIGNVAALVGTGAVRAEASTVMGGAPDYFRELGVRPFINASGTYTAMTASLMPPEVMEAINYASNTYVMLEELQVKVGERIATLVQAEGRDGDVRRRLGADARNGRRADRDRPEEDGRAS